MPFDGTRINPAAAHLLHAKQYIIDHGWCSKGPYDDAGRVCIAVAICKVCIPVAICGGKDDNYVVARLMERGLGVGYAGMGGIGRWNDTPGRTLDEVMTAFDRAIELAMVEPE